MIFDSSSDVPLDPDPEEHLHLLFHFMVLTETVFEFMLIQNNPRPLFPHPPRHGDVRQIHAKSRLQLPQISGDVFGFDENRR